MVEVEANIKNLKVELVDYQGKIIAVSKYVDSSMIERVYLAGIRNFGESKAIESLDKINNLPEEVKVNSAWHFIGHLQTNKAKYVVGNFDYIHSVDSLKLAKIINDLAKNQGIVQKILVQVNISQEETKFGCDETTIFELFGDIIKLENVKIEGLMTMAPFMASDAEISNVFRCARLLKEKLQDKFSYPLKELSMGMSNDYHLAVEQGASMIRVGTKIFK